MKVTFFPSEPRGRVTAPPSKSMAHRYLICAGKTEGTTVIENIEMSEDISATSECLRALGAEISVMDSKAEVKSLGDFSFADGTLLNCRESGSTLRFLIPSCLNGHPVSFTGSQTLFSRPLNVYEDLFRKSGISFEKSLDSLCVNGVIRPGTFEFPGNISSQFVSGLLFALPTLTEDSRIVFTAPPESLSYIRMTLRALSEFGIRAYLRGDSSIDIPGGQIFSRCSDGSSTLRVEGDWSNAAFLVAMGLEVRGINEDSIQGDKKCLEYFSRLDDGPAQLDITDCPDLGPVLMAYAAMRSGAVLTGTERLRFKESDRGEAMKTELAKFGVIADVQKNYIEIGSGVDTPAEPLFGHNDHRIVMALSVICARTGGTIIGAEAVRKSFPDFFGCISGAEIRMEINDGLDQ
ncbi:MAG: 3-phosphoshikimate 1-carboxyvinyltransferase [Clostridia bacterium]|nr:3-phosphoshikimate 1-carboxyvinyltransferase [Clostridia bacterium]